MSEPAHGRTLLQIRASVFQRWFPLLAGPPMLIAGMFLIFVPGQRGIGVVMLLFGVGFTAIAIRGSWQKAVLIEVQERGIQFYANVNGICVSFSLLRDLFIPWERLEVMRFLTLKQVIAEGIILTLGRGPVRPGCIALQLKMDAFWPPPGTLREGRIMQRAKTGEIYFLTSECTPAGKKLWTQMTGVVARYGGGHIVIQV